MVRLQRTTPYLRLCEGEGPPIYLQAGQAWSEGGAEPLAAEALPAWFDSAVMRLTLQARREVGWQLPDDPALPEPPLPEPPPAKGRGPRIGRPREG